MRIGRPARRSCTKAAFDLARIEDWKRAADRMYILYEKEARIYLWDDGFLDRERWNCEGARLQTNTRQTRSERS